jgi:hypothetical protein
MAEFSDEDYLEALRLLRSDLEDLLSPQAADQLGKQLDNLLYHTNQPERLSAAVDFALDSVRDYEPAIQRLKNILEEQSGEKKTYRLRFSPVPGPPIPIPSNSRVCCPVDPTHLRTPLRRQGQRCPQHNVLLVPCDLVPPPGESG